ncbi:MAG TPA: GDSL family lipase [Cyanobacteria bacterium UBA11162]|nr:GDSL family lipase [Cyanobacteria bacterium UBA11162]
MKFYIKNSLLILISVLFLVSASLNLFLIQQLREYYLFINAVSLDPLNFQRYPNYEEASLEQNLLETNKTRVVIFGDSRSQAWRNPELNNFEFINRGISGETSSQAFLRFDYHVSYLKPQVIVVQVGGNDLRMLPLPPKERKDIVENCKANIRKIAEKSQDLGSTVILTTIFPLGKRNLPLKDRFRWPNLSDIDKDIEDVNSYIRSLENKDVIIFDAYAVLEENGKTKNAYTKDLLHINSAGYEALNRELVEILQKIEKQNRS